MKTNDEGVRLILGSEGFRSKPYLDFKGIPTIGYGSTRYADGKKVSLSDKAITEKQAMDLFRTTLVEYEKQVSNTLKVNLTDNKFSALVSLVYNIGIGNFLKTRLYTAIKNKHVVTLDMFTALNRSNGQVLRGLTIRRTKEFELFCRE